MSQRDDDVQRRLPSAGDSASTSPGSVPPSSSLPDPRPSGGKAGGLVAIGAVALLLTVVVVVVLNTVTAPQETPETTGSDAEPTLVDVELGLFVERDGRAEPLLIGQDVAVGDRLLFELTSEAPARVRLWIEEDGIIIQDLGAIEADDKTSPITTDDGMLAWGFGSARTVTVRASGARSGCPAASCSSQVVRAR